MASSLYDSLYKKAQVELAKILQNEESSIIKLYGTALYEIRKILKELYDKYAEDGKLTNAQMTKYNRLKSVQDQVESILKKKLKEVDSLTKVLTKEQYQEAFYRHAYAIDQAGGMALNWGLIPKEAVEEAMKSPFSKLASSKALSESRTTTVEKIKQEIGLSIIRGDSYEVLGNRIDSILGMTVSGNKATHTGKGASYRSLMVARTEGQRVLVDGHEKATAQARKMGCDIETIWDATLDGRTRPSHAALEGKPKDDPDKGWFVPEVGWVSAPLHSGVASFDINCRCRTRDQVRGYPPEERYVRGDGIKPYETYDQWMGKLASENEDLKNVGLERTAQKYQMYKLRNGKDSAIISDRKLKEYCLSPDSERGSNKARVIKSALGIGQEDYKYFEEQIRKGLSSAKIKVGKSNSWGRRYDTIISIKGKNGNVEDVIVGWIFDSKNSTAYNGYEPRLTTAYIKT